MALCAAKSLWKTHDNYLQLKSYGLLLGLHLVPFGTSAGNTQVNFIEFVKFIHIYICICIYVLNGCQWDFV